MEDKLSKEIIKQYEKLRSVRQKLEHYWTDAYKYTLPHRGLGYFTNGELSVEQISATKGTQAKIFDSTCADGAKLLAKSLKSGMVPSSSQWFDLQFETGGTTSVDTESALWLQKSATKLFTMIHSSNFDKEVIEALLDLVISGQFALYVTKEELGGFKFETWMPSTLMFEDTLGTGQIDTIYRKLSLTAQQIVHKFGIKNLPQSLKEAFNNNSTQTFSVIHTIRPRMKNGKMMKGKKATEMPFESIYVLEKDKIKLQESGYHEFPVIIPRWTLIPGTQYALGPVNDVMPDTKSLNKVVEMNMLNAEMNIFGIFIAGPGVVNGNTFRVQPRTVNVVSDINRIKDIKSPGNYAVGNAEIERMQKQIRTGLMTDELSPMQKNYASATEVLDRAQIIRQMLGPDYARLQSEFLEPLINRCFGLAYRDGSLGEAPEGVLNAGQFVPVYKSPLAKVQKQEELRELDQFEITLANKAQINPSVLDLYDDDEALRIRAELLGIPIQLIRSPSQVEQIRQKQMEAQQAVAKTQTEQQDVNQVPSQEISQQ